MMSELLFELQRDVCSFNSAGFAWWFLTADWGIRFSSATSSHFSGHKIGLADLKNGFWILFSRLAKEIAYVCWPLWQHMKPLHLSWCWRKAKVKRWHRNGFSLRQNKLWGWESGKCVFENAHSFAFCASVRLQSNYFFRGN